MKLCHDQSRHKILLLVKTRLISVKAACGLVQCSQTHSHTTTSSGLSSKGIFSTVPTLLCFINLFLAKACASGS